MHITHNRKLNRNGGGNCLLQLFGKKKIIGESKNDLEVGKNIFVCPSRPM
jgi:hypothetical protein